MLGYRAYWGEAIVELLVNTTEELSIDDIAQKTSITHADVMNTYVATLVADCPILMFGCSVACFYFRCTTLQLFKHYKGQHVICLSDSVLERYEKSKAKRKRRIHSELLLWKPPVFTRDQLRFGW